MGLFKVVVSAGKADEIVRQFKKKDITVLDLGEPYTPSTYTSSGQDVLQEASVFVEGAKGYKYLDELASSGTIRRIVSAADVRRWDKEGTAFFWGLGIMLAVPVIGLMIGLMSCVS